MKSSRQPVRSMTECVRRRKMVEDQFTDLGSGGRKKGEKILKKVKT